MAQRSVAIVAISGPLWFLAESHVRQGYDLGGMAANTSIKELHQLKSIINRLKANDLVLVDLQKGRVDSFPSGGARKFTFHGKKEKPISPIGTSQLTLLLRNGAPHVSYCFLSLNTFRRAGIHAFR